MSGKLYLCATPIGNLEDMTFRVVRTLKEVDLIAAEDTRNSIKLLNHFEIKTPMTSYHEYNKVEKAKELIAKLQSGMDIALITDAGTPAISDPGEVLVAIAMRQQYRLRLYRDRLPLSLHLLCQDFLREDFVLKAFCPLIKKRRN